MIRLSSGAVVYPGKSRSLVITVTGKHRIQYHRAKFLLAHGWLPREVDHRDGDRQNNLLSNYRPATRQQQSQNRGPMPRKHDLPRGVYPVGRKFRAMVQDGGKLRNLGLFECAGEAALVAETRLKQIHGEFYRDHSPDHEQLYLLRHTGALDKRADITPPATDDKGTATA